MYARSIEFFTSGKPVTQGSMVSYGKGRMVHQNPAKLKGWREDIAQCASSALFEWEESKGIKWNMDSHYSIECTFYFHKPKTGKLEYPREDVDKLTRAVLDSLTFRLYEDDSQVVSLSGIDKTYTVDGQAEGVLIYLADIKE